MMASGFSMDSASDVSDVTRRQSAGGGALAVNKSSGKIGKKPVNPPRPPPKVYIVDASNFRSVVQKLTGTPATGAPTPPKPIGNPRLRRMAPPLLQPNLPYAQFQWVPNVPQQFSSGLSDLSPTGLPTFNGFGQSFSVPSQRIDPILPRVPSPQTFPTFALLPPNDNGVGSNQLSPGSAAVYLVQSIVSTGEVDQFLDMNGDGGSAAATPVQETLASSTANSFATDFSFSPRWSTSPSCVPNLSLGSPSPRCNWTKTQSPTSPSPNFRNMASGLGIGHIFQMGVLSSPTSGLGVEPNLMLTGFS